MNWRILPILLCLAVTPGCFTSTVKPKVVEAQEIAYDNGVQNAGVLGLDDTGAIITPTKREEYNALIALYGKDPKFLPPLRKDDGVVVKGSNFHITNEALINFTEMKSWQRSGKKP